MRTKLLKDLSTNTLQLIVNQLAGSLIFYLLSTGLDKNTFGQINLALAILLFIFNLLSLGIEQVAVRKNAAGEQPGGILSVYLVHVLLTGVIFYVVLIAVSFLIKPQNSLYPIILLIGLGKLMIYLSTPFKQTANGLERFRLLAWMLVVSNLVRASGLVALTILHVLSLQTTVIIFIAGDALELAVCILLFRFGTNVPVGINFNKTAYINLLREALPQMGVTLITSAMARFDWIFIGFMLSTVKLAEYSFAYKVFEISTLPLLAIAPLLLPWFTKLFKSDDDINTGNLKLLLWGEMLVAALTILLLNILWSPVIDAVTGGKYGAVNAHTIFILSLCIPLMYLNNFLWTINFAKARMKIILTGFILTLVINVGLDIILIPLLKNEGAALAFLGAMAFQGVFYIVKTKVPGTNSPWLLRQPI